MLQFCLSRQGSGKQESYLERSQCLKPIITSKSPEEVVGVLLDSQAGIPDCLPKLSCVNVLLEFKCKFQRNVQQATDEVLSFFEFFHIM